MTRRHVLFIDDEPRLLKLVSRLFGDVHDFVACDSGAEALEHMRREQFDVVVCDVMMPELNGKDLHEQSALIDPEYPGRFVFVTGGAYTDPMDQFLRTVPNTCIPKPFAREELLEAIEEVAGQ